MERRWWRSGKVRDGRDLTFQRSWKLCEDVYTQVPSGIANICHRHLRTVDFQGYSTRNFIHGIYPIPTCYTRIIYTRILSTVEKKKFASSRDLMFNLTIDTRQSRTFVSRILRLMGRSILSIWKFFHQLFIRNTCRIIESNNLLVSRNPIDDLLKRCRHP